GRGRCGLPGGAGLGGRAGNSGVWIAVGPVTPRAAAFLVAVPHRSCPACRRDAWLASAVAVASPVLALNLAVITTDPPVLALILLSLPLATPTSTAHPASTPHPPRTARSKRTRRLTAITRP